MLEALGARIDLSAGAVASCIEEAGFGFMFAPAHHQATRFVIPARRELAVRTIFNLLGPLTNPAGARRQLIGVSDASFLDTIAGALAVLGVDRALVVAGEDGIDEISVTAPTTVVEVNGQELSRYTLTPGDVGIELASPAQLEGELAGVHPRRTPPSRPRSSRVRPRPAPRAPIWPSSTPVPPSTLPGGPTASPRACRPRARRSPVARQPRL